METVRLEYDIGKEELATMAVALTEANPGMIRGEVWMARRFIIWVAVLLMLVAAMISLTEFQFRGILWAIPLGAVIGTASMFHKSRKVILDQVAANVRNAADTPAGRNNLGRRTVTCDPDGLTVETRFVTTHYRWAGVTDVFQSDPFLFIQFPGPLNFGIPAWAFRDEGELGRFAERVRKWVVAAGGVTDPPYRMRTCLP